MGSPPPIWNAASKEWVQENFVGEANKNGKLYVRKDGDWLEIPPNANPGPYLPLSGGTMTGPFYVKTSGWVDIEGGAININCPSSHIDITSPGISLNGPINVSGHTTIGAAGVANNKNLRVHGTATANTFSGDFSGYSVSAERVTSTGYAELQGSDIRINSYGSVHMTCPYSYIRVASPQIRLEGSNLGQDNTPIVNITSSGSQGNNPRIEIGSSNYDVKMRVWGAVDANSISGNYGTADGKTAISVGSGIEMRTNSQMTFTLDTTPDQWRYWPYMQWSRYGGLEYWGNGITFYHNDRQMPQAYSKIVPGSAILSGSFVRLDGYTEILNGASINGGMSLYGDLYISSGNAYKPGGGSWTATSDARLKSDVEDYTDGLDKLTQLKPIRFRYNERARMAETGKQYVGLAAEEAKEVMPSIVGTAKAKIDYEDKERTEILTVDNSELIYTVINALKQIDERLKTLEEFYSIQKTER